MKLRHLLSVALLFLMSGLSRAEPSSEDMNRIFGLPLWQGDSLWNEPAENVAKRMGLRQESKTSCQSSYRLYAGKDVRVLGARPYSMALYGENGTVHDLSIVFANRGDFDNFSSVSNAAKTVTGKTKIDLEMKGRNALMNFPKALKADSDQIEKTLTDILGAPKTATFGQVSMQGEYVKKWDWHGHLIILSMQRDQYVGVRIISQEEADKKEHPSQVQSVGYSKMRQTLQERVEKRPNGDVVVTQIPMTDQGPKGYCVPATVERYLRYMGIDADMYVIAMACGTGMGGSTSFSAMESAIHNLVLRNSKHLEKPSFALRPENIARYIDAGLPLMWGMFIVPELNQKITERSEVRRSFSNGNDWKQKLKTEVMGTWKIHVDPTQGHMCMIIGYNKSTGEIAISDSWGARYTERWITAEEAAAVTQNCLLVISY